MRIPCFPHGAGMLTIETAERSDGRRIADCTFQFSRQHVSREAFADACGHFEICRAGFHFADRTVVEGDVDHGCLEVQKQPENRPFMR